MSACDLLVVGAGPAGHSAEAGGAWYANAQGTCVGVLTHDRDPDYETGQRLIAQGASAP